MVEVLKPVEKAVYSSIPEDKTLKQDLMTYILLYGSASFGFNSASNTTTTLYTVPQGYYFYITNYSLSYTDTGAAAGKIASLTVDGGVINRLYSVGAVVTPPVLSVNPATPQRIKEGQVFAVVSNDAALRAVGSVTGYLVEIAKVNLIFQ